MLLVRGVRRRRGRRTGDAFLSSLLLFSVQEKKLGMKNEREKRG